MALYQCLITITITTTPQKLCLPLLPINSAVWRRCSTVLFSFQSCLTSTVPHNSLLKPPATALIVWWFCGIPQDSVQSPLLCTFYRLYHTIKQSHRIILCYNVNHHPWWHTTILYNPSKTLIVLPSHNYSLLLTTYGMLYFLWSKSQFIIDCRPYSLLCAWSQHDKHIVHQ